MLPILPQDKANHLVYGLLISIVATTVAAIIFDHQFDHSVAMIISSIVGAVFAGVAGVLKEVLDLTSNKSNVKSGLTPVHGVEVQDAIYTAVGGMLPLIPIVLVHARYL